MSVNTTLKFKKKLLFILHYSPPLHGAAIVGNQIKNSNRLKNEFKCRFIKIKSSKTLADIGKINPIKLYFAAELYVKVFWALLTFRPQKIYFTANVKSLPFYRDILISILWKFYRIFKNVDIFYHYHMKGVNSFVKQSRWNLILTHFFINDVNLILLSKLLKKDFKCIQSYKKIIFLNNGIEDTMKNKSFEDYIESKYTDMQSLQVLFMSNMFKSKGYKFVLDLANKTRDQTIHYHFAGSWPNSENKEEFFEFIEKNKLFKSVTYHGFVIGDDKGKLLEKTHLFILPTQNDTFSLSILEALSYGIPVIATNQGTIPMILDKESGIILDDVTDLENALLYSKTKFINQKTAIYCRKRFLEYFTNEIFESNLINILK